MSCGGGEPHSQDSPSSPPTPLILLLYHAALQSHETAGECRLSPQRSGRCVRSRSTRSTPGLTTGEDRSRSAGMRLPPPWPCSHPGREAACTLHEAHASHDLDALICHFPGCLQKQKHPRIAFGARPQTWLSLPTGLGLTEPKILLMAASIWKSVIPWSMLALTMYAMD